MDSLKNSMEDDSSTLSHHSTSLSFDSSSNGSGNWNEFTWDGEATEFKHSRIYVTVWETLESVEIEVHSHMTILEFRHSIHQACPKLRSKFAIFYLRNEGLWEKDRMQISNTKQFNRAVKELLLNTGNIVEPVYALFLDYHAAIGPTKTIPPDRISPALSAYLFETRIHQETQFQDAGTVKNMGNEGDNQIIFDDEPLECPDHASVISRQTSVNGSDFNEVVFQRDGAKCVFCSQGQEVLALRILEPQQWHALDVKALGLNSINDVRNGITICVYCHDLFKRGLLSVEPSNNTMIVDSTARNMVRARPKWSIMNEKPLRLPKHSSLLARWPMPDIWLHRNRIIHSQLQQQLLQREQQQQQQMQEQLDNAAAAGAAGAGAGNEALTSGIDAMIAEISVRSKPRSHAEGDNDHSSTSKNSRKFNNNNNSNNNSYHSNGSGARVNKKQKNNVSPGSGSGCGSDSGKDKDKQSPGLRSHSNETAQLEPPCDDDTAAVAAAGKGSMFSHLLHWFSRRSGSASAARYSASSVLPVE